MLKQKHKSKFNTPQKMSGLLGAFLVSVACINSNAATHKPLLEENTLVAEKISSILEAQPDEVKTRYAFRRPAHTLDFLQIKPGMKVIEVLPGGGWYTKLLLPLLGEEGELVGVDYPFKMWPHFSFMTPERIEAKKTWVSTWTKDANSWRSEGSAKVSAFQLDEMPASMEGTVDAALYIRALHNLARHEEKGPYIDNALKETYKALKPGGLLGVVQHQAYEDRPDDWANGKNGYLKKSYLVKKMSKHGFKLIAESDINANHNDQANVGDNVWRLPPSLRGNDDNPVAKQRFTEVGESNRMTLLFKKIK